MRNPNDKPVIEKKRFLFFQYKGLTKDARELIKLGNYFVCKKSSDFDNELVKIGISCDNIKGISFIDIDLLSKITNDISHGSVVFTERYGVLHNLPTRYLFADCENSIEKLRKILSELTGTKHSLTIRLENLKREKTELYLEMLEVKDGKVFINNNEMHEPYIKGDYTFGDKRTALSDNQYYVLGDNREPNQSTDSRILGPVSKSKIQGKVIGIFSGGYKKVETGNYQFGI